MSLTRLQQYHPACTIVIIVIITRKGILVNKYRKSKMPELYGQTHFRKAKYEGYGSDQSVMNTLTRAPASRIESIKVHFFITVI